MKKAFFSVDVHGANSVWRKWLKVPELYNVDALLLCGDLTGKSLVPIIKQADGTYNAFYFGRNWNLQEGSELDEMEQRIMDAGAYTLRCDKDRVKELQDNPSQVEELMMSMIKDRMAQWMEMLIDNVDLTKVDAVVMPGNDDDFEVDEVIRSFGDRGVVWCLDDVIEVLGIPTISLAYVNPTPWDTPREEPDKKLAKRIQKLVKKLPDPGQSIFNFHPPPFGTMLDLAPELDANKKPVTVAGQVNFVHVGSKAVLEAVEKYQPLIGLHGHIHESYGHDKIGSTPVVNPGSEYGEGILRGYIIEIDEGAITNHWKVEG
ncbi:phosphoesterase [candidate division WOR-3 bacterium]|uniref:Phosphoesterase n=1 Tax=candidate division WOR-3 bacterium TaxID=2052148 RepID=A0A9D5K921_UNCW3|nr:phosphoesterase [candidate division WOR-3 bacterium]MBD3364340.1 phosphoesterase [candidate division WOR-3 bacterium]